MTGGIKRSLVQPDTALSTAYSELKTPKASFKPTSDTVRPTLIVPQPDKRLFTNTYANGGIDMKETLKYGLAIGISAAAMFAYMYEPPPDKIAAASTNSPPQTYETPALNKEQRQEGISKLMTALNSFAGEQQRTSEYWDAQRKASDKAEREAYERINIEPWNVRNTRYYSAKESNDGVERFEKTWEFPRHHYYSASTEDLLALAYDDALAAKISADRLIGEDKNLGLSLLFHAAALSGKPGPILDIAQAIDKQLDADLEPAESDYLYFALKRVAKKMGYTPRPLIAEAESKPEDFSLDEERLKALSGQIAESLANQQTMTLGSTSLKELFDA